MESVTLSVRVPRKLKEELTWYRVEVSKVVRRALEEEIRRRRLEELRKVAAELGGFFSKIPDEKIIKSIKEARAQRRCTS